ncbi:MAG: aminomethyl transferase family protein [Deltaproteobacteria bacterium]|nr:aminomethyl transferase family protein [Deltaproteobacteria bacterium]
MPNQSPLKERHQADGAAFAEEDGWILPLHFGDPLREYHAVRSQVGLLDLCHCGLLRFTGPDRVPYLQGMVSNDVKKLVPGEGTYAAVLDIQGKILADIRIFCTDDSLFLDLRDSLKESILRHLNRYLIADDVEITDLTGQYGMLSLQGPKTRFLLKEIFPHSELPAKELAHAALRLGDAEIRIARCTHTGEEGYDLVMAVRDVLPAVSRIQEKGKQFSPAWIGTQAQEILRVEAGIPRYGIDMSDDTLLLETGLDKAVSFQKGCYLGQEVVERVRSRGHVNKKLAGMVLEGDAPAEHGSAIRADEKEIGRVTSSIFSPARNRPLALGYVHRDYLQPGTRVAIVSNSKTIPALVSALPFYPPS